MTVSDWQ